MAVKLKWYGTEFQSAVGGEMLRRTQQAADFIVKITKEKVSRPNPTGKDPSLPGEFPKMVTGGFRDSITSQVSQNRKGGAFAKGFSVRIGATKQVGDWNLGMLLDLGTSRMLPRPWAMRIIRMYKGTIASMLARRSGQFGRK